MILWNQDKRLYSHGLLACHNRLMLMVVPKYTMLAQCKDNVEHTKCDRMN